MNHFCQVNFQAAFKAIYILFETEVGYKLSGSIYKTRFYYLEQFFYYTLYIYKIQEAMENFAFPINFLVNSW